MFRDIHQLRDAPPYGITVMDGLASAELSLEEALKFVPYCPEHLAVWSPRFTQIILDCCSQVDSLWKATEVSNDPSSADKKRTIKDYWGQYGTMVAPQKVIFFGGPNPAIIEPFSSWANASFTTPPWWDAYNKLKHNRFSNQTDATLSHAVNSVGALLLAIIYSGVCDLALINSQTLDSSRYNHWAFTTTGLLRDVNFECHSKIESRLFAHPLGIFAVTDCNLSRYWESKSPRFNMWWALNSDKYTKPRPPAGNNNTPQN